MLTSAYNKVIKFSDSKSSSVASGEHNKWMSAVLPSFFYFPFYLLINYRIHPYDKSLGKLLQIQIKNELPSMKLIFISNYNNVWNPEYLNISKFAQWFDINIVNAVYLLLFIFSFNRSINLSDHLYYRSFG